MQIEGQIQLHPQGYYAIYRANYCHVLKIGDQLLVYTGDGWVKMEVAHNLEGYYLRNTNLSFHPRRAFVRLIANENINVAAN